MKHRELSHRRQPIPAYPMQLRQNTRPVPRRELHGFEFSASIGPHAEIELIRILIAAENRRGTLEIRRYIVGVGDRERGRIES